MSIRPSRVGRPCRLPRFGAFTGCSTRRHYANRMSMAALLVFLFSPPLDWGTVMPQLQRDEQSRAYEMRRRGALLPLTEIERRVLPTMAGARYLGPEIDTETCLYTRKFLRNGTVIWLRIDGRSGQIIESSGN